MTVAPKAAPKPNYVERSVCRACLGGSIEPVLSLGELYLPNFVTKIDSSLPRAPLDLGMCRACGLLQLRHTTNPDLLWREYWYRSSINGTMREALDDVVTNGYRHAKEGVWLDIGANDGYLLSRVSDRFTRIGCEPAMNLQSLLEEQADHVIPDYFSADRVFNITDGCDVITSCAMFYDLDEPDKFVHDIAQALRPGGVWINQLNDAPTMLRQNAFDAICHEHLCYYDVPTLEALYNRHGLYIKSLSHNSVNGGSVRIVASAERSHGSDATLGIKRNDSGEVEAFARRVRRWKTLMNELLEMPSVKHCELWGLGASTKGAILLQYLDMTDRIVAIGDRNPAKTGLFMAGTWTPVFDEPVMRKANPRYVIPLIWGFMDEILEREPMLRANGTVFIQPLPNPQFIM